MAVREFDGVDDIIHFPAGGVAAVSGNPITVATLWKSLEVSADGIIYAQDASVNRVFAINPYSDGHVWFGSQADSQWFASYAVVDDWRLDVATCTPLAAGLRGHSYVLSAATWAHSSAGLNPAAGNGVPTEFWVGRYGGGAEYIHGRLAALAVWDSALSDATVETLTDDFSLSGWAALDPVGLWGFNQASASDQVLDLTGGGADSDSITGTTIITGDDPPGFGFSTVNLTIADAVHAQTAQAPHFETVRPGGWHQLSAILQERDQLARDERDRLPTACPNDGEPLRTGPGGVLFCPFDGWRASA